MGRIFSIPPGAAFLPTLAGALIEGRLVDGFKPAADDPLALSRATIYVPTRRAARALRSSFVDLMGGRSAILPVVRPLGEIDEDAGYFDDFADNELDRLVPISPLSRSLELAQFILAWRNRLPDILRQIHDDSPLVAPASPADAIWLAQSLTEIIDAVETEETGWEGLNSFDLGDTALWWRLSGEFMKIASSYWPARLVELHRSSPAAHRAETIRAEAARYAQLRPGDPVIVAGSTGSIPATAELIASIHGLDCGVVVLPGLDTHMSDEEWRLAGAMMTDGTRGQDPAGRGHPQYGLFHLMRKLGADRDEIEPLGLEPAPLRIRSEAVSRAFRPADAEVDHHGWRQTENGLAAAFSDVALIEAANEREEALSIAIAMKLALSESADPNSQAALVTPDRMLARRVCVELARFGIEADDSAGTPLAASQHGALVRLALESILRPGDPVALVGLLKHPLIRLGHDPATLAAAVDTIELLALRGGTGLVNPASLTPLVIEAARSLRDSPFRKRWQETLLDDDRLEAALHLAQKIETAVEPLAAMLAVGDGHRLSSSFSLGRWAEATGRVLEALCVDEGGSLESLWSGDAGDALAGLLGDVIDTSQTLETDGPQWIDAMQALIAGIGIRPRLLDHPRAFIWGTLEARLQHVDTLVLGGLNEGQWPSRPSENPFLSRAMKTGVGLEPPERRIGQAAHDFMMGMGTNRLILTRALRQGGAPSVASRFVQRLAAVIGEPIAEAMRDRGARYQSLADMIDLGGDQDFARRPDPRPDPALQPTKYSFSEAGRLRRDPYSIYAHRILKLDPIAAFNADPGARERGEILHAIVERYIRLAYDPGASGAFPALMVIADEVFDEARLPGHIDVVWRARFRDTGREFLRFEADRRHEIATTHVEVSARMEIAGADLAITGRADRIDIRKDGKADIIDYKSGLQPSVREARSLLEPQLPLEAAALAGGAFRDLKPLEAQNLLYVRLRPGRGFKADQVNNEDATRAKPEDRKSAPELADESVRQLSRLVEALRLHMAGFKSRVAPFRDRDYGGDYDHLARVAEWSTSETAEDDTDE